MITWRRGAGIVACSTAAAAVADALPFYWKYPFGCFIGAVTMCVFLHWEEQRREKEAAADDDE